MIDTGVDIFLANKKNYLHNTIEYSSGIGVTRGLYVGASYIGDSYFLLESPTDTNFAKVTDVNCLLSSNHNAFSLGILKQIGFKDAMSQIYSIMSFMSLLLSRTIT